MTNTATAPEQAPPISEVELLRCIATAVEVDGLPMPGTIGMATHSARVGKALSLDFGRNAAAAVDAWAAALNAAAGQSSTAFDPISERRPHRWMAYAAGASVGSPVIWHGWGVYIWSAVDLVDAEHTAVEINA